MAERTESTPAAPDAVLRALADPHRRQILRLVRHTELPAGRIAASFPLTQQAVSQHLGVLKQAGLLAERREGTRRLYTLRREALDPVRELLHEFWPDALHRLKQAVETAHPRPPEGNP
ncbi:ArsR/SmtB family transcription factor [Micromonospora sp. NPDC000089]|uniref:ArsR/SmtB family transcription factor n=1 Tax=unclassified Micromonospora TaxID=2617518 RepID=UPI00368032AD